MNEPIASVLLLVGGAFMLLAGIAVIRMPDVYMRMSATTKAGTLGLGCILLGMVVHFGEPGIALRGLAVAVFGFLTAPVAAHMIARAAYLIGVPLWEGTTIDELSGRYHAGPEPGMHALESTAGSLQAVEGRGEG
jgi:multicomponent Na+:H+ antiporter subunit G